MFLNKKPDYLIETSFLIPLKEDKNTGNGDFHPVAKWEEFYNRLYSQFEGYTVSRELMDGCYRDPDTNEKIYDTTRRFYIAISTKSLNKMRVLLRKATATFCQKSIYFVYEGKVEFIEGNQK